MFSYTYNSDPAIRFRLESIWHEEGARHQQRWAPLTERGCWTNGLESDYWYPLHLRSELTNNGNPHGYQYKSSWIFSVMINITLIKRKWTISLTRPSILDGRSHRGLSIWPLGCLSKYYTKQSLPTKRSGIVPSIWLVGKFLMTLFESNLHPAITRYIRHFKKILYIEVPLITMTNVVG